MEEFHMPKVHTEKTSELIVWDSFQYDFHRRLGNFIQYFQADLPKNAHGIPIKYIDPTIIAQNMMNATSTDDIPEMVIIEATVDIEFDEGFPTVCSIPLWERLDGESVNFYKVFKQYREMKYVQGVRAISKLSDAINVPGKILNALAKVYHWNVRCKAYDNYKEIIKQLEKQQEVESMLNKHSAIANQLLEQSMTYLEKHPEQLNPKIAVQMIQLGIKTGRSTLGLSNADKAGNSPASNTNIQINNSPEAKIETPTDINTRVEEKSKDPSYLSSILHILDKSGAFKENEVIDVDSEAVEVPEE